MPEGPEVAVVADELQCLTGRYLVNVLCLKEKLVKATTAVVFPLLIERVYSRGKKVIFQTPSCLFVTSLGMTGRFSFKEGNHSHVCLNFSDSGGSFSLFYDDVRTFGNIHICDLQTTLDVGPDLLAAARNGVYLDFSEFVSRYQRYPNKQIAVALLDQEIIAGIGNYLKSEILYYASIYPFKSVSQITPEEWQRLWNVSHQVILYSYQCGGFTIKDYISPSGKQGLYPAAVYNKSFDNFGKAVKKDADKTKRSTFWVPEYHQ